MKYPSFKGDPLSYFAFKKQWKVEVEPEKQIECRELFNLKDNIPLAAKNKLTDIDSLAVAWEILDREYGNLNEIV